MPNDETLEARLKKLVQAAGSQKQVARLAGVSDGTLINWSRGLGLRESKLREVAYHLGVSADWLRDGDGDEEAELAAFRRKLWTPLNGPRGRLKAAREQAGLSLAQLSRRTGYPVGILESVEEGHSRASERMLETLSRELPGVTLEELMSGSDEAPIVSEDGAEATYGTRPKLKLPPGMTGRYVPLLSQAQAGQWDSDHTDALYDYTAVFAPNVDDRRAFAIRVSGNSMEPDLHEGDVVVCSPAQELHNGDAAVIRTHSEQAFIKYWQRRGERVVLESANPAYSPIEFPITEIAGAWPIVQQISSRRIKKQS